MVDPHPGRVPHVHSGPWSDYRRRRRAGRLVAFGAGVIAAAVLVLATPALSIQDATILGDCTLVGAIAVACYVVLFLPQFRPGTGFQLVTEAGRPACVAVSTPGSAAMVLAIAPPLIAHSALRTEAGPYQLLGVLSVVAACLFGLAVLSLTERRRVVLTADGVQNIRALSGRRIPWDQIVPGQPSTPARREPVLVRYLRPDHPRSDVEALRHKQLSLSPVRLAAAIRFYVDHPARRSGIGTTAELAALLADLERETRANTAGRGKG